MCHDRGAMLIFDEILSGFKTGLGGAQELYGVIPDLTLLSKCLSSGVPPSVLCGRRDIMSTLMEKPPQGAIQGGTFRGASRTWDWPRRGPPSRAALGAVLLSRPLDAGGVVLPRSAVVFDRSPVPARVQWLGCMSTVYLGTPNPVTSYAEMRALDPALARRYFRRSQSKRTECISTPTSASRWPTPRRSCPRCWSGWSGRRPTSHERVRTRCGHRPGPPPMSPRLTRSAVGELIADAVVAGDGADGNTSTPAGMGPTVGGEADWPGTGRALHLHADALSLLVRPGGSPANVGLARPGVAVGFAGRLSTSGLGPWLTSTSPPTGSDVSLSVAAPEAPTLAMVGPGRGGAGQLQLLRGGHRRLAVAPPGAPGHRSPLGCSGTRGRWPPRWSRAPRHWQRGSAGCTAAPAMS